jgi:hypothetical protein
VVLFQGIGFLKSKGHGRGNGGSSAPGEERLMQGELDGVVRHVSANDSGLDMWRRMEVEERVAC